MKPRYCHFEDISPLILGFWLNVVDMNMIQLQPTNRSAVSLFLQLLTVREANRLERARITVGRPKTRSWSLSCIFCSVPTSRLEILTTVLTQNDTHWDHSIRYNREVPQQRSGNAHDAVLAMGESSKRSENKRELSQIQCLT